MLLVPPCFPRLLSSGADSNYQISVIELWTTYQLSCDTMICQVPFLSHLFYQSRFNNLDIFLISSTLLWLIIRISQKYNWCSSVAVCNFINFTMDLNEKIFITKCFFSIGLVLMWTRMCRNHHRRRRRCRRLRRRRRRHHHHRHHHHHHHPLSNFLILVIRSLILACSSFAPKYSSSHWTSNSLCTWVEARSVSFFFDVNIRHELLSNLPACSECFDANMVKNIMACIGKSWTYSNLAWIQLDHSLSLLSHSLQEVEYSHMDKFIPILCARVLVLPQNKQLELMSKRVVWARNWSTTFSLNSLWIHPPNCAVFANQSKIPDFAMFSQVSDGGSLRIARYVMSEYQLSMLGDKYHLFPLIEIRLAVTYFVKHNSVLRTLLGGSGHSKSCWLPWLSNNSI